MSNIFPWKSQSCLFRIFFSKGALSLHIQVTTSSVKKEKREEEKALKNKKITNQNCYLDGGADQQLSFLY